MYVKKSFKTVARITLGMAALLGGVGLFVTSYANTAAKAALAAEKKESEQLQNRLYYSENMMLYEEPITGVKSSLVFDWDQDGIYETAEIVVSSSDGTNWTLVYQEGENLVSTPIFVGNENGFVTSIMAGHIVSPEALDFLVSTNLMSMPFGGSDYELYSLRNGVFEQVELSSILDGTEYAIQVDEDQETIQITANGAEKTVKLSDWEIADYKRYGNGFCQNFFIELEFTHTQEEMLPELITTEVIAAVLPNTLVNLHTTYRYIDGEWKAEKTEFFEWE